MAKDQSDYFKAKQIWSKTKDSMLGCYLAPYFSKVIPFSKDGIVYVDAFAGAGVFEDGDPGSSLIALSEFRGAMSKQRQFPPIIIIFAEKDDANRASSNRLYVRQLGTPVTFAAIIYALRTASRALSSFHCRFELARAETHPHSSTTLIPMASKISNWAYLHNRLSSSIRRCC